MRHRLLRAKGAVQQTVGCGLWAMPGPDPAVCSRRTRSHMMPSQLRKQSAEGLGQPRFWPAGRVFVGRGGAAGEEPRTYSGRGHGRCRRFGTPLAVTHASVSRADRCDRVHEKYICGAPRSRQAAAGTSSARMRTDGCGKLCCCTGLPSRDEQEFGGAALPGVAEPARTPRRCSPGRGRRCRREPAFGPRMRVRRRRR